MALKEGEKKCLICNNLFISIRSSHIYCSKKCNSKAQWRKRNAYKRKYYKKIGYEQKRNYYLKNKKEIIKKTIERQKSPEGRIKHRIALKKWRINNPNKIKTHTIVYREKLRGNKCEICGSINDLQAHHPDYSKPKQIITLCRICHMQTHSGGRYYVRRKTEARASY